MPATRPRLTQTELRAVDLCSHRARVLSGLAADLDLTISRTRRLLTRIVEKGAIREEDGYFVRVES